MSDDTEILRVMAEAIRSTNWTDPHPDASSLLAQAALDALRAAGYMVVRWERCDPPYKDGVYQAQYGEVYQTTASDSVRSDMHQHYRLTGLQPPTEGEG